MLKKIVIFTLLIVLIGSTMPSEITESKPRRKKTYTLLKVWITNTQYGWEVIRYDR